MENVAIGLVFGFVGAVVLFFAFSRMRKKAGKNNRAGPKVSPAPFHQGGRQYWQYQHENDGRRQYSIEYEAG